MREMVYVVMVVGVVLCAVGVITAPQDDIILDSGGYKGVEVAISDLLNESRCAEYVSSVKTLFGAASELMFNATGKRVFFGEVVIVLPQSWACQGVMVQSTPLYYSYESAHFRMGPSHYLFGDNPWTLQLGGCGKPGEWLYLPEKFVLDNVTVSTTDHTLVHEWAKYRWGVFEEYGHAGDNIFPLVYRDLNNTFTPTYCTDHLLEGNMSCPENGVEADCRFTPFLTQNITITSSLLAAPFLSSVVSFCQGSNHNSAAPTKHNLLCDRKSVKDVMGMHTDMKRDPIDLMNTTFTVVRGKPNWPRIVLLIEYSSSMGSDNGIMMGGRWEHLRDNVRQFIKMEAVAQSYVGVVVFDSSIVSSSSTLLPLNIDKNREQMASLIPEKAPAPGEVKKNINTAIQTGLNVLGAQGGTLVLVTQNLEEYTTSDDLVQVADGNPVWPILYPSSPSVPKHVFEDLAKISPDTTVLEIPNSVIDVEVFKVQSTKSSADLHYSLTTAFRNPAIRVASDSCIKDCILTFNINDTLIMSHGYVKIFRNIIDVYVNVTVTDFQGNITNGFIDNTNMIFPINTSQNGQYKVAIVHSVEILEIIAELWAVPRAGEEQASLSSPEGLHSLLYSEGHAPRLVAEVTNNYSWPILYADVTAQVVEKSNSLNSMNIILNDGGTGGDVTGRDGIYSGYLVGFKPKMDVDITLTVTDNNGSARVIDLSSSTFSGDVTCCGSQLDVSKLQLKDPGNFAFSSRVVSGRFIGELPGQLPPGRVTDLQATRSGREVTLSFTAPGAQLDQGIADWYAVISVVRGESRIASNTSGMAAGSVVESKVTLLLCNEVYIFTVVANSNGVNGSFSNSVREQVSCDESNTLNAGAIAGIVIGCITGVFLLLMFIYLCFNRDHLDELWVWRMLTCRCCPCCRKSKDDDLYSQPSRARRSDIIRTNTTPSKPVRNLTDLYSRPKVEAQRQQRAPDEDDGGFGERHRRQLNMSRKAVDDEESVASSTNTIPINQVGSDNHGYDDGPYTIYRNAPPVPAHRKANTQV